MAKDKLPYFKWYPKDFDHNEKVRLMNLEEIGLYALCLNHSWVNGSLPADLDEIGRAMKVPPKQLRRAWPRVAPCFIEVDGRLVNPRQEDERAKAIEKSGKCTDAIRKRYGRATSVGTDVTPRALGRAESESGSGSSEWGPGVFDCRSVTQQLWDIHPSPSEFGFVEAAVANEMRNSSHSAEVFAAKIADSLRAWVEYWTVQKRYPIGLKKWVESGDYAKVPPYKATGPAPTHYETPEEREERITREDAARRRG